MSTGAIISMVIINGTIIGGFIILLRRAIKTDRRDKHQKTDD